MSDPQAGAVPPLPDDVVCQHGTAMDVHCCHCHSGFIFDSDHECPASASEVLHQIGVLAMTAQSNPHASAAEYRRALIDICNLALKAQDEAVANATRTEYGS